MEEEIKKAIEEVRPSLQADGGDIEFVSVSEDGVVQVELQGSCSSCPMAKITLQEGVQRYLKENVAGVTAVQDVS